MSKINLERYTGSAPVSTRWQRAIITIIRIPLLLLLVGPSGIEPLSSAFQTGATTTLAQDPLFLVGGEGNAPSYSGCKPEILLLN